MDPALERIVSEDEAARAAVEVASATTRARLQATQADLAHARAERLCHLTQQVDEAVAQIVADTDREIARRVSQRDAYARARAAQGNAIVESAVDTYLRIVRDGPQSQVEP